MKGLLFIALACFFWALDTLIRYPLLAQGFSATQIVLGENLILALLAMPVLISSRSRFLNLTVMDLICFLVIGILGQAVATLSFTKAFGLMNPSVVILLQKLQPIVAIFFAHLILKEPVKKVYLAWALVSFIGGALVSFEHLNRGAWQGLLSLIKFDGQTLQGLGLTLVAVFGWGISTVLGKKLSLKGLEVKEIMAGRFFIGLMTLLVWAPQGGLQSLSSSPPLWGKIALMVFISGLLGLWPYYKGLKLVPARLGTLLEMFFPFFAIVINWAFLDMALGPWQLVGGALLLLGAAVIQWKHY